MQVNKHFKQGMILLITLMVSGTALQAQTTASERRHSAMVSKAFPTNSGLSFDASIMPDSTGVRFILTIDNPSKNRLNVILYHNFMGEVFRTDFKDEVYRNRFDLSNAEDGTYTIEITNGRERFRKNLEFNTFTHISRKIAVK